MGAPVVLAVAGDQFLDACRITAIIWEGATTAGDTVSLVDRLTGDLLWPGRTNDTQTYLGANIGPSGIDAPRGFLLQQISAGRVCVYLRED